MRMAINLSRTRGLFKCICYIFIAVVIVEVVVFNAFVLMAFMTVKKEVSSILDAKGNTLLDKLMMNSKFQDLVHSGRSGGFAKLLQETVGRLYVISYPKSRSRTTKQQPQISRIGVDVSNAGESLYLYRRIQSRSDFPYEKLIIDIGANDGLLSSNSFNFIEWGWSAILVEPQAYEISLAKQNSQKNMDPYNEGKQTLTFFEGILADKDGYQDFVVSSLVDKMESHMMKSYEKEKANRKNPLIVKVPSLTVKSFASRFNVPMKFGILSIDAEGVGDKVIHQWMDLGFRPAYIIYEQLHNSEHIQTTTKYLEEMDYRYLTKLGWNYMFEHVPVVSNE